jgi:hypothetical protein
VHQNGVPLRAHQIHVSAQDGGIAQISCYDDSRLGSPKQINGLSQFHCITLRLNQAALLQFLWDSSGLHPMGERRTTPLRLRTAPARCAATSPAKAGSLQNYRSVIQFLGIQEMIRWRPKQRLN